MLSGCSVLASGSSTPSPSALLDLTRLYQASESAVFLTAYVMPSYASIVSFDDRLTSSTTATLGMSGWFDLSQSGLAPDQKHQAFLAHRRLSTVGRSSKKRPSARWPQLFPASFVIERLFLTQFSGQKGSYLRFQARSSPNEVNHQHISCRDVLAVETLTFYSEPN